MFDGGASSAISGVAHPAEEIEQVFEDIVPSNDGVDATVSTDCRLPVSIAFRCGLPSTFADVLRRVGADGRVLKTLGPTVADSGDRIDGNTELFAGVSLGSFRFVGVPEGAVLAAGALGDPVPGTDDGWLGGVSSMVLSGRRTGPLTARKAGPAPDRSLGPPPLDPGLLKADCRDAGREPLCSAPHPETGAVEPSLEPGRESLLPGREWVMDRGPAKNVDLLIKGDDAMLCNDSMTRSCKLRLDRERSVAGLRTDGK